MRPIRFPRHAEIHGFDFIGGELAIGGIPITRLAHRVGRTPFYAYSRDALTARVQAVRAALPAQVKLHYAMKANPMPAVVGHLCALVDGLDVASAGEMHVALNAGATPQHVSFAGPGKTASEIAQAIAAGITLSLESERQYQAAMEIAGNIGIAPRLAIRVNPSFELKSSGMKMGGGPKPFGIDEARVPALIERMRSDRLPLIGLHIYAGSQTLDPAAIVEAQQRSVELAVSLARNLAEPLQWVNIGGGFGVPYFPGQRPLDLGPIGAALEATSATARSELQAPLVLELGRYLVAEAGVYVCRVVDRKESGGQVFLVVDGGLHHNLAASGNFGQVIRKNYPAAIANRLSEDNTEIQSVVGPLCTPLDLLVDRMELPSAAPGDLVAIFMAGAYGVSASPTAFLSHPPPAEVLV